MKGSDAVIKMLLAHKVKHVFGVPGDTSMNIHNSFLKFTNEIQHILARDERNAGYMADAYGRVLGVPGIVETPSGGGALYVAPAVSEANNSNIPMICMSSDISMNSEETHAITDVNQELLFKAVTKWNTKIRVAEKIPDLFRKAFRMAAGGIPGAVHVSLPENILGQSVDFSAEDFAASKLSSPSFVPNYEDIATIIDLFAKASRPIVVAGGGVHLAGAYNQLEEFRSSFNVPVATTINGKGSVQEFLDNAVGVIGANGGSEESLQIVQKADLILVLGSKLNNVTTLGKMAINKSAKLIQVDIGEEVLGLNIPAAVAIKADIQAFLLVLNQEMSVRKAYLSDQYEKWNSWVREMIIKKRQRLESEMSNRADLVLPGKFFQSLEALTDENTIFVGDAGTPTPYLAAYFRLKKAGRGTILPRAHGSLGYALPAAIGVQVAKPNAKVFSLMGDASFGMALGDLETAKRLQLPIIFVNFENNCYGWIKKIQQLYFEENYFAVDFSQVDPVTIARGFGVNGMNISNNEQIEQGIKWALAQTAPVFLNVVMEGTDQFVPPVLKWERDSKVPSSLRKKLTY